MMKGVILSMGFENKSIIAITGPSGVGKTTLGEELVLHNGVVIPYHCTTRRKRDDDKEEFYRYLSHEEYRQLLESNLFLLSSGDGPTVKKEYGNFYGVLQKDCFAGWEKSDLILLFVSYKDLNRLIELKQNGYNIDIVNLTFKNLEDGIKSRLTSDIRRNHSEEDILRRIDSALTDEKKYGLALRAYAKCVIYTDIDNINQTYEKVCDVLKLRRKHNG